MATATEVRVLNAKPLLLQPRPLSREPGSILLVRLLPERPKAVRLPWELWSHILRFVVFDGSESVDCDSFDLRDRRSYLKQRNSLLCVCKDMLEAALPLLYTHVRLFSTASLEKFVARLDESEQRWDSLRHNPFSTPGRWVQSLSIAHIPIPNVEALQATAINILLTRAFPLLPFLRTLCLHEGVPLSTASLHSLGSKVGLERLTTLRGVHWGPTDGPLSPALETLARCNQLERLEIINSPIISSPLPLGAEEPALHDPSPFHDRLTLNFPRLTYLSVVALSPTSIIAALLHAVLPELRHLMITPSDDSPDGVANTLLTIHGSNLQSLRINSPCCWPTLNLGMPPFAFVLQKAPRLRRLTLDYPLIPLAPPLESAHPLQVITIPRPNHRFLTSLEALLPQLPHLTVVRLKNVKWLKSGMYGKALESGVQGEMREWRRRLAKKKVRLVDASWRDPM